MPCPLKRSKRERDRAPNVATLIGRGFELYLLRRVSRLPQAALREVLDHLEDHRLIRSCGEGRYAFADDGLRTAASRQLLGADRRRLHARIARVLPRTA